MGCLTYKHSFNSGDLLTMMPGMQKIYRETGQKAIILQRLNLPADYGHNIPHPVKNENGVQVCMNKQMFDMMKPLIEAQEYVERFDVWEGESVDFDFDLTRMNAQMPLPGGSIHHWASLIFPQLECDLSKQWIECGLGYGSKKIIINRTGRYQNPYINYFFLKEHQDHIEFAGTEKEHEMFCNEWGLNIRYLKVDNFLALAKHISNSRFMVGGQSLAWHISDGMKQRRILEVCSAYPNTFPTGANGYSFISQVSLEFQFNKLLKETE